MAKSTCKNCGAELEYAPESQSLKCLFCGAAQAIPAAARDGRDIESNPDAIVPFAFSLDVAEKKALDLMAQNHPYLLREGEPKRPVPSGIVCMKRERLYVPAFVYTVDYSSDWTASFGYGKRGEYIDWRPASGVDSGTVQSARYAGSDLRDSLEREWLHRSGSPAELIDDIAERGTAVPFDEAYVQGVLVEAFPEGPVVPYADAEVFAKIRHRVHQLAQGDQDRDWRIRWCDEGSECTRTHLPVFRFTFEYRGTSRTVLLDGIDGESYLCDAIELQDGASVGEGSELESAPAPRGGSRLAVAAAAVIVLASMGWYFGFASTPPPTGQPSEVASANAGMPVAAAGTPGAPPPGGVAQDPAASAASGRDGTTQPASSEELVFEGTISRGAGVSTIYDKEAGVSYAFATDSEVGAAILKACQDGSRCRVEGTQKDGTLLSVSAAGEASAGQPNGTQDPAGGPRPSFDCASATTGVERLICSSPELSQLDSDMATAFEATVAGVTDPNGARGLRASQRVWLGDVSNRCADADCLKQAYMSRIAYLASFRD